MKTKTLIFYLLFVGMSCFIAKGQKLNLQVINTYHSSVAAKVYDIVCQIPLNENRQLKLAAIFQSEDSAIFKALTKSSIPKDIDLIRTKTTLILSNFFTIYEIEKIYTSKFQSQFTDVLLLKKIVKLKNNQIDSLIRLDMEMKDIIVANEIFDDDFFERQSLSRVLTSEQFNSYLAIKTKKSGLRNAAKDWNEMIKLNIVQPKDSIKLYKNLVKYNIARSSAIDRYQDIRKVRNEHLRVIEKTMSPMQMELERARKIQKKAATDSTQNGQKFNGSFQW